MLVLNPRTALLMVLLVVAACIDLRSYRIPNWLTAGGIVAAMMLSLFGPATGQPGWIATMAGMAIGFAVMLPTYLMRVMGAGDVKLMAMTGAFLGTQGVIGAVLFTLIAGGVLALLFAFTHGVAGRMFFNVGTIARSAFFSVFARINPVLGLSSTQSVGRLPYGVSIAAGTIVYLVMRQLGYL